MTVDLSNNSDLTAYKGAWIFTTEHYGSVLYEAIYNGHKYSASSQEKLIEKLDNVMSDTTSLFRLNEAEERTIIETDEEASGTWAVVYQLAVDEVDDSFDDDSQVEVMIEANSFNEASKYAEQYLRMKQNDSKTADKWNNAEIISINQL